MNDVSHPRIETAQVQLGKLLARARVLQEITQQEMAHMIGVSERAIQRMEGGSNATLSIWLSAAQQLGYLDDIVSILKQDKPKTLEQLKAIEDRTFRRRVRVRK